MALAISRGSATRLSMSGAAPTRIGVRPFAVEPLLRGLLDHDRGPHGARTDGIDANILRGQISAMHRVIPKTAVLVVL